MSLNKLLPSLDWLGSYTHTQFKNDLSAGLTVGIMLIPQGMAYAMIAGLPPIYGLYASTIPLLIYAFLGTSRHLAVGPVAMVSLLTAAGIGTLAEGGTEVYIALAITLAFLVGLIQFLLGIFRLGFLVNFLSHPVISGFTSAAALIIGLSQLKHLLGINLTGSHHVHEVLWHAIERIGETNWITFGIGVGGILLLIGLKNWFRSIPAPLVLVVSSILLVYGLDLPTQDVKIVGAIPSGLPSFSIPDLNWNTLQSILPVALAISLVSFMESIAVAKAIQSKHKNYKVVPNQELKALGLANLFGSFFQSYPVTGGFSRTAVNDQAGAKTGMASVISAFLIVLTLLYLTPLFYYLPNAVLASIIMVAVFGLIDVQEAKHLWTTNRSDFWMLAVTFFATLALGVEQGIGIGVVLSLAMIIFQTTRPHIAELGRVPQTHFYRNVDRFEQIEAYEDLLILRCDAQLYFANSNYFRNIVDEKAAQKGASLKSILLNFDSINNIDSSALHMLKDLIKDYRGHSIDVFFSGIKGPVRDAFQRSNLTQLIGIDHCFMSVQEAVNHIQGKHNGKEISTKQLRPYLLQTN